MKKPKTFEEGMQRLQQLLSTLQSDTLSLNESIGIYAEAAELIRFCNQELDGAKLKIDEINAKLEETLSDTDEENADADL